MTVVTSIVCQAIPLAPCLLLVLRPLTPTVIRSNTLAAPSVHNSIECIRYLDGEADGSTYLSVWMRKVTTQARSATTIMIASASFR